MLALASLTYSFTIVSTDPPLDKDGNNIILKSLEKRWATFDQEVFIAAVIVNPLYRKSPLALIDELINANVMDIFACLYCRFYQVSYPPATFGEELYQYLNHIGKYSNIEELIKGVRSMAASNVSFLQN